MMMFLERELPEGEVTVRLSLMELKDWVQGLGMEMSSTIMAMGSVVDRVAAMQASTWLLGLARVQGDAAV